MSLWSSVTIVIVVTTTAASMVASIVVVVFMVVVCRGQGRQGQGCGCYWLFEKHDVCLQGLYLVLVLFPVVARTVDQPHSRDRSTHCEGRNLQSSTGIMNLSLPWFRSSMISGYGFACSFRIACGILFLLLIDVLGYRNSIPLVL